MFKRFLREIVLIILLSGVIIGCSKKSKNELDGITFSYKTYVSENSISEEFNSDEFKEVRDGNLGFFRGTVWTEFVLSNRSDKTELIVIGNDDKLNYNYRLFHKCISGDEETIEIEENFRLNFNDSRSFPYPKPNFKIELEPNSTNSYILQSTSDGRIVESSFHILSLEDYLDLERVETNQDVLFFGTLFIIFLINVLFWRVFKDRIHAYYSLYILSALLLYLGLEGYLNGKGLNNYYIDHLIFVVLRLSFLSLILFSSLFLRLNEAAPRFHIYLKRIVILVMVTITAWQFILFNSSIKYLHFFENIMSYFWVSMVLVVLFISIKYRRPEVRYYLIALIAYLSFILLGALGLSFDMSMSLGVEFATFFKIGTIIEVVIFTYTIILVLKLNRDKQKDKQFEIQFSKEAIESENKELKNQIKNSNMQKMEFLSILKLIESNLKNEEKWTIFKDKVNEVNPNFLKKLQETHQKLSKTDLRLLLLVKLGFTQKEIASMLFIAEGSVKKSKQRVRKKLGLSPRITLTEYLSKF